MEDEPEQLDWGNEEDELHMSFETHRRTDYTRGGDPDDAEDAVSLGGDDEDDPQGYAYQSRSQDEIIKVSGSSPPKVLTLHQTPHHSGQETQITHSNNSQKPPQSQSSSQPSPLRSHSLTKLTHALPPKPVAVSVPFLHHSDPSIIEATAMSRSRPDRDKKPNGNPTKSNASGDVDALPPDWEVRRARSGNEVYYYNVRTFVSTWKHPAINVKSASSDDEEKAKTPDSPTGEKKSGSTASKPSEQRDDSHALRSDADSQLPVLSYQDRHYRPGGDNLIHRTVSDSYRPDERPSRQSTTHTPRSYTPPASPKPERARSPLPLLREQSHRPSSRAQPVRYDSTGNDNLPKSSRKDDSGSQTRSSGHHWEPSHDSPQETTSRQTGFTSTIQPQAAGTTNFEASTYRPHGDANMPSTTRYRSPPPHMRRPLPSQAPQTAAPAQEVTTQKAASRHRSRFDQPGENYRSAVPLQERGDYALTDVDRRRDQLASVNVERSRVEHTGIPQADFVANNASGHRSSMTDHYRPPVSHPDRPISPPPPSMPLDQSHSRQRPQLVLQNTDTAMSSQERPSPGPTSSIGYRDSSGHPQGPPHSGGVPSGPRSHPQTITSRGTKHPESPQGLRAPPSGPSRGPRETFYSNELPTYRGPDVTGVDIMPPSRAPNRLNDMHIRAGAGMYADREQDVDLPKGPRAMSSKPLTNSIYPPQVSPTMFVERNAANDHSTNRFRERSPPHPINNDGWERHRDAPERQSRPDGYVTREDPAAWRTNSARWDDPKVRRRIEPGVDEGQAHSSFLNQNRRPSDSLRPLEPTMPTKTPVASDAPAGSRAGPRQSGINAQPEVPYSNAKVARQGPLSAGPASESIRDRDSRIDFLSMDAYEPSSRYNVRNPPEEMHRNTSSKIAEGQYRRPENDHADSERRRSMPMDTYQNTAPNHLRRDSSRPETEAVRFDQPAPNEKDKYPAPRIWTPRQPEPGPPSTRTRSNGQAEHRRLSLPPVREPPIVSPSWDLSMRTSHRQESRHQQGTARPHAHYEDVPRMDVEESSRHLQDHLTNRMGDRYPEPGVEHPKSASDLERRLGERYDDRYEASYRQNMPTTLNRRDHEAYPDDITRHPDHHQNRPNNEGRGSEWTELERRTTSVRPSGAEPSYAERVRVLEGTQRSISPQDGTMSARNSKPNRRRFGPPIELNSETNANIVSREDMRTVDRHLDDESRRSQVYDRGHVLRRGTSLLDRLSLDAAGVSDAMASTPLRDRVMIPAKRDRGEMIGGGDMIAVDVSFEMDEGGDGRRNRRRSGKPRRGKGRMGN